MLNNMNTVNKVTACLILSGYSKQQIKQLKKMGYTTWYTHNGCSHVCNTLTITSVTGTYYTTVLTCNIVGSSCGSSYSNKHYYSSLLLQN